MQTSAKTAFNVKEAFEKNAQKILSNIIKSGVKPNNNQNVKIKSDDEILEKKVLFVNI